MLPKPCNSPLRLLELQALKDESLTADGRKAASRLIGKWRRWASVRGAEGETIALAIAVLIPGLLAPGGGLTKARIAATYDRLSSHAARIRPTLKLPGRREPGRGGRTVRVIPPRFEAEGEEPENAEEQDTDDTAAMRAAERDGR